MDWQPRRYLLLDKTRSLAPKSTSRKALPPSDADTSCLQLRRPAQEGISISLALLTVAATLAVAVVATTWRPVGLDLEAEVSASRAISIFVRAGRVTAALTVAHAILVLPDLVYVGVGFAVVLVSVLISVVVQDREDARDLAVHVKYDQQYVELTDSRWETLRQRHPWATAKKHRRLSVALLSPRLGSHCCCSSALGLPLTTRGTRVQQAQRACFRSCLVPFLQFS